MLLLHLCTAIGEAGVILEEHLQSSLNALTLHNKAKNFERQKGLVGMIDEDLCAVKSSLFPEGLKFYCESKELPTGATYEFLDGYKKVTISPCIMDGWMDESLSNLSK